MKKILFVCLGNICRSPLGEGIFKYLVEKNELNDKYIVDSAGTSAHHIGEKADHRMRATALEKGITLTSRARQVQVEDFNNFDVIIAMDKSNKRNLQTIEPENPSSKTFLMRDFDNIPEDFNVPDPYYGGQQGFYDVFDIVDRSCKKLFNDLENNNLI